MAGGYRQQRYPPDRYEKKVTFHVANGTWNGTGGQTEKIFIVELKNGFGEWDEGGSATNRSCRNEERRLL